MLGLSRSYYAQRARSQPSLPALYDFTQGSLPGGVAFSRSSDGYYVNAAGDRALATAGQARLDHDPSNLTARGLLLEPSGSNLLHWNQDLSTSDWTRSAFSPSAQTTTAPDGSTLSGWDFGNGYFYQDVNSTDGTQHTVSVWLKANQACSLGLRNLTFSSAGNVTISVTTQWQRFQVTNTVASTARFLVDGRSSDGFGASGLVVYVWMPQIEEGATASSEIATTSSSGTRAADVAGLSRHSGTFDVAVTDENDSVTQLAAEPLSPGWWPALGLKHVKSIQVFDPGTF